jgi:hypothetical protein
LNAKNSRDSNCVKHRALACKWNTCHKPPFAKGRFGGNVNITAEYPHKKIERSILTALFLKCHTLTDYRTIVDDFYKVVEFVEWLKKYYPDKA